MLHALIRRSCALHVLVVLTAIRGLYGYPFTCIYMCIYVYFCLFKRVLVLNVCTVYGFSFVSGDFIITFLIIVFTVCTRLGMY